MNKPGPRQLLDPVHLFALGFGSGLSPWAPGTMGTAFALGLDLVLRPLGFVPRLVVAIVAVLAGVWICEVSSRRLGVHDHPAIVWDEVAAFLLIMLFVPFEWPWIISAFVVFRFFDIFKPWPIRDLDHSMSGGLGIMLDDVIAALYTVAILVALQQFL